MNHILELARKLRRRILGTPEQRFDDIGLKRASGVVHIGANTGQERDEYARRRLPVIWVEPIPSVFQALVSNISSYPQQVAYCYLLSDNDDVEYDFHIASNGGASSSMFQNTAALSELYPDISFTETIRLKSARFDTFVARERINLTGFNALILDVQGAELLILRGASLDPFDFIKCEVGNGLMYQGGPQLIEIDAYLLERGFVRKRLAIADRHSDGGFWGDAWYARARRTTRG